MSNKRAAFAFNFLTLIPSLIKLAEVCFGKGNGQEKKTAVIEVAGSLLRAGGAAVATNNPQYADTIGQVIDATVTQLNATGQMPGSTPPPADASSPPA